MAKPLIIVESPTKVKTIKKYVGNEFDVAATAGHIKDLPTNTMGIDIEDNFKPHYEVIKGKQKVISELKSAAKDSTEIYLAPDPDREGEAIAYHTSEVLQKKGRVFYRVLFHELTKSGIADALKSRGEMNHSKYDAQQTRRILDRLVGYHLSPLLWKKVQTGLSAGRVQSVALRIICDREKEIMAFTPEEYWTISALLNGPTPPSFTAKLAKKSGEKISIPNQTEAEKVLSELAGKPYIIDKISKKTTHRNPLPPFITSKLQQEAIKKLRFTAKKTMVVAQHLYEGYEINGEPVGLITYMRTDSTRIAAEAALDALDFVRSNMGAEYAQKEPRYFANKNKVQDAHEAIRPTNISLTPEMVAPHLDKDHLALYELIWKRFVASQMTQAIIDQNTVAIRNGEYIFTVTGSTVRFPGFMALYMSSDEDQEQPDKQQMPKGIEEGMEVACEKIEPKQHFTQPPPRFSEATLVKELEENGIGRPSTYATILTTIQSKGYVELINRYFRPSELGLIVNDLLIENFPVEMDVEFTAKFEENLDKIEAGEAEYLNILNDFYEHFTEKLDSAAKNMLSVKGVGLPSGLSCPQCNGALRIKTGKNGPFLACEKYPDCSFSCNYTRDEHGVIQPVIPQASPQTDKTCPKCEKPLVVKHGRFGDFLACSGYPGCKHTESLSSGQGESGSFKPVACPNQGCGGQIGEKRSKRGKIFYGCSKYPDCDYATWDKPVDKKCPDCGHGFLSEKSSKIQGMFLKCPSCGYSEQIEKENAEGKK